MSYVSSTNMFASAISPRDSTPITLSWNVDVFAKLPKSIAARLKDCCNRSDEEESYYDPNTGALVEPEDKNFKPILRNGIFENFKDIF